MVGAGFSKNASNNFPDWNQLGDKFIEIARGVKPSYKSTQYQSILKIAEEVEAIHGRTYLNKILRQEIPDENIEPSALHVKALELPWSDIFTTNYDTLLERARKYVYTTNYDVVVDMDDLVFSTKPRIIKLHGSFPSKGPFIITEEDYRIYPEKFAPFINTVQQSLLENSLCLIGFSGSDPNFLKWIGWIRDNLGEKNAPKIYLIGILDLTESEFKYLDKKNIVAVNLGECLAEDEKNDHNKALNIFFDYLKKKKDNYNKLNWPTGNSPFSSKNTNNPSKDEIHQIIKQWKEIRLEYPQWLIAPTAQRENIWIHTQNWEILPWKKYDIDTPFDIEFLYEMNWRFEITLTPINKQMEKSYEMIITKYWPFAKEKKDENKIVYDDKKYAGLKWRDIRRMWISLTLALLRSYREDGLISEWEELNTILSKLQRYFTFEE
ncbi:MAG: SIR2 family protein, partial [Candidatus Marinimicrobia bacterium]|nr:SIR2 family protein [Candidatus Neomarinimicrobiota bacterium]